MTLSKIVIGAVARPQGVRGEIKITPLTDDAHRFEKLRSVYIDGKPYEVKGAKVSQNGVFLTLRGVDDRNAAELLRNKTLEVDRKDAVKKKGQTFIVDVIGCEVYLDDETYIGTVEDVLQYGAADVYVVSQGKKKVMFPSLKRIFVSEDTDNKKIILKSKEFSEVAVYED